MESIFALQPTKWLHDAIITWWFGYWCDKTGGISNYSITTQGKRNQNKINGQRKPFFATPFSWKYVMDGNIRGANKTKYVDIFTCSKRDTCWPPRGLSQNGFRQLDIIVPKTQHNHCMQRTRLLKNFIHSSIRVLPCLHCRSEKGKP
jgi:hypothetical protein